ncbi:DUF916 and DUF3324 domain-containing protein [Enterococcus mundtii]|uniref:Uncharacterized protein n=1 Tax=Enterococcus mundtii TaxID=53346 RepID=A0A242KUA0_ENTMU|nr:DUF916 and DUF3324 domain-containing protein [Enterococcus mundtii]OTP19984.1 hypothetical protein A5802_003212 [Enterococcus mundtii]OTP24817.1 hypothetical protein A5802_002972 [Enterococcus mundtii]
MRKLITLVGMLAIVFFVLKIHSEAYAQENNISFSVEALTSSGESNNTGFYKFEGEPGKVEKGKIAVTNLSHKKIKILAEINPASTNQNGIISYRKVDSLDSTLQYPLDALVTLEHQEIELAPEEKRTIEFVANYPEKEWTGQILGGIRFSDMTENNSVQTVTHQIAYTIGVLMSMKGGETPENQLQLNQVKSGQRNYHNYIEGNIQNTSPVRVNEMSVSAKIVKQGNKKLVYERNSEHMRMAPNSNFDFGIPTGKIPLKPGKYSLKMRVVADKKTYDFEKSFQITKKEADKFNKTAIDVEEDHSYIYILIISILLLILFVICIIVLLKEKINNKNL